VATTPRLPSCRAALLCALAFVACGRTVLDLPPDGTSPSAMGGGGAGGAAGHAGSGVAGTGVAGTGVGGAGIAGTTGIAGTGVAGTGVAGTGATQCVSGTMACNGPFTAHICAGGFWGPEFKCPMGCINGACAECTPGTSQCATDGSLLTCGTSGFFLAPTPCPNGCNAGACDTACTEGDTLCVSSSVQETCKGGNWTAFTTCEFVCAGKACGKSPRQVFVTSTTIVGGSIGGLPGADDFCRTLAVQAGLGSSYSAWLSDAVSSPLARFAEDVGPYQLVDGTIVANNWKELTSGKLRHAIDLTERVAEPQLSDGACAGRFAWSDTTSTGDLVSSALSCQQWSDPMGVGASWASTIATTSWSDACEANVPGRPDLTCLSRAPLICVEQ
jgi:hypothetical protein